MRTIPDSNKGIGFEDEGCLCLPYSVCARVPRYIGGTILASKELIPIFNSSGTVVGVDVREFKPLEVTADPGERGALVFKTARHEEDHPKRLVPG